MTTIEPFHVNGWTIKPCYQPTHGLPEEGVDLVHGAELYHYDTVGQAVLAAQRSHRESLEWVRPTMDPVEVARLLVEKLKKNGPPLSDHFVEWLLRQLLSRIDHYEEFKPSWQSGTPEEYDAWLRDLIPDDNRLRFYQWIGEQAVTELVEESRKPRAGFDSEMIRVSGASRDYAAGWNDGVVCLQADGQYPSVLPLGRPFCDISHHTHTDGGGRLSTCRLDSEE